MKRQRTKRSPRRYVSTGLIDQVVNRLKKGEALLCFRYGVQTMSATVPTGVGDERQCAALLISKAVQHFARPSVKGIEVIEPPATPVRHVGAHRCTCGAFLRSAESVCFECA